jgi:hypothetical protein
LKKIRFFVASKLDFQGEEIMNMNDCKRTMLEFFESTSFNIFRKIESNEKLPLKIPHSFFY